MREPEVDLTKNANNKSTPEGDKISRSATPRIKQQVLDNVSVESLRTAETNIVVNNNGGFVSFNNNAPIIDLVESEEVTRESFESIIKMNESLIKDIQRLELEKKIPSSNQDLIRTGNAANI
uniref:Conjugal transfer protein TraG n=1 Tax=Strongyloides venezuelensis TaxID=75913 RepID=A0A0K0F0Q2_STRVS